MSWQFTVLSLPILLALAISLCLLGYLVTFYGERRRDPVVALYFWIIVAAIVWTAFSGLKLLHTEPATKLLFYRFLHLGAAALPPLMFLFVVAFTDRTRWLRYEIVGSVFLVPVVFCLLLFVGPDGLIVAGTQVTDNEIVILRVADGPGFALFSVYSILLVAATVGLVLVEVRRVGSTYYPQALLIAVAVMAPMLVSILMMAEIPPFVDDRINFVPTSAAISIVLFGVLLYRYRLVDLPPLAYATAMKHSPDVLFVLDQEARVVSTNEHGSELLALLNGGLGSPLSESIPAFDPQERSNDLIEIAPSSGDVSYYRVFIEPLIRGGKRLGWVVVLRDETDQQRQQERLQQKNEQLELLASTVSHDLRNPLEIAIGYLEVAQQEFESEKLDEVANAHARMEEIIDEVLTLARAGNQIDDPEVVPTKDVVQQAWRNVKGETADLTVEVDRTVIADLTMLKHIFENLFRNAVEHGGEDVTVTVGDLEDGIYVEDDGAGIPPEERAEIFEVGYSRTAQGTGFGLSIVKRVVNAHGWEIDVTEGTDGGARFEITGIGAAE